MSDHKSIDELVANHLKNLKNAEDSGKLIEAQASSTVVLFIDLTDSTAMKSATSPAWWLGHIYEFIKLICDLAKEAGGTVVKRIGDEVMLTFSAVPASEQFLDSIDRSKLHSHFSFKIAADWGNAYHFSFEEGLVDDPYGEVVDRCARIAKYCKPGVTLCSGAYVEKVGNSSAFYSLGSFSLKGFRDPQPIFVRKPQPFPPSEEYLNPLLEALNAPTNQWTGIRLSTRAYTPASFALNTKQLYARPFLLRELLTLPRLPYSFRQFCDLLEKLDNDSRNTWIGYYVEWEAVFREWSRERGMLAAFLSNDPSGLRSLTLFLVPEMYEIVTKIKKGARVQVRGVIIDLSLTVFLDYVDLTD
jgi:class 3 adenylate cyclase